MAISKNQRFGLITFFALIAASVLVTIEPWKGTVKHLETSMADAAPPSVHIQWDHLYEGYPETQLADTIRSYHGFDLAYNETFEQASWVAYVLTRDEVEQGTVPRTDNFRPDTTIPTGSAVPGDYRGSGYDRGHLAPAADMKWDPLAMSESFLLSNMSPQVPAFNRGIWRKLEERVRDWAIEKDSLYVITGPVLNSVQSTIGSNQVGVPAYYFKVLVDLSPPNHSIMAFLLPNERSTAELSLFAVTIDSLERFTGYDFFANAPDQDVVDWLEAHLDLAGWN